MIISLDCSTGGGGAGGLLNRWGINKKDPCLFLFLLFAEANCAVRGPVPSSRRGFHLQAVGTQHQLSHHLRADHRSVEDVPEDPQKRVHQVQVQRTRSPHRQLCTQWGGQVRSQRSSSSKVKFFKGQVVQRSRDQRSSGSKVKGSKVKWFNCQIVLRSNSSKVKWVKGQAVHGLSGSQAKWF